MESLEKILQTNFNCKKPFLKNKKHYSCGRTEVFTVKGGEAYKKLTDTLYAIGTIIDNEEYSHCIDGIIERLDEICDE